MAAQELRWLTYLLTDLGEQPRSPPVLYVDNKAMIALCQEHRLEHETKHIALRYFLAQKLQQCGQLRLRDDVDHLHCESRTPATATRHATSATSAASPASAAFARTLTAPPATPTPRPRRSRNTSCGHVSSGSGKGGSKGGHLRDSAPVK
ncbi:unnamed protein product [Closterium sp. NIES-54]